MDLWDVLKVAVAQWRVLIPLLVLTVTLSLLMGSAVDPEYGADGSLLLVGPNETPREAPQPAAEPGAATLPPAEPTPLNPYLSFSSSLPITAQALGLRLRSAQAQESMADEGLSTSYEVTIDSRSPIMQIEVRADDPETAVASLNHLIDIAGEELTRIQSTRSAPEGQFIALDVLDQNTAASTDSGAQNRVRLLILGLGIAGSIAAAYATEGIVAWQRQHRPPRQPGRHSRNDDSPGADDESPEPEDMDEDEHELQPAFASTGPDDIDRYRGDGD